MYGKQNKKEEMRKKAQKKMNGKRASALGWPIAWRRRHSETNLQNMVPLKFISKRKRFPSYFF